MEGIAMKDTAAMAKTAMKSEAILRTAGGRRGSRQQERTDATRRKLLAAAEKVFARSGYEAARLEDIAASAGYTRGAFYANFDSKEDIFFALLEQWVSEAIRSVASLLARYDRREERAQALRQHYVEMAQDRRLMLFSLEYKLFAVRHPEAHARIRARQDRLKKSGAEILSMVSNSRNHLGISNRGAATALGALSHSLLLERLVNPQSVSDKEVRILLGLFFDALIAAKD
jgi:AcrR family transcriptional regulator